MKRLLARLDRHRTAANLFVALSAVLFYFLLTNLSLIGTVLSDFYSYISPFVAGVIIAYILLPLVGLFENHLFAKMKNRRAAHSIGVMLTLIVVFAAIALLLYAVVPELIYSSKRLVSDMDTYFESLKTSLRMLEEKLPFIDINIDETVGSWREIVDLVYTWVSGNIEEILGASYRVGSGLVDVLITIAMAVYILFDSANFMRMVKRILKAVLKPERYERYGSFAHRSDDILKSYLVGNLLDSLIIGVANFIFMVIAGMPCPGLISVIVGVTNYIPTFGPFIGAIPSTFIILLVDPGAALIFVIFTIVLQQIDAAVIKPLLFGDSTGLSPLWVLFSIIVFGRMFGFMGMLFGVPMFAILSMLVDSLLRRRYAHTGIEDVYCPTENDQRRTTLVERMLGRRRAKNRRKDK